MANADLIPSVDEVLADKYRIERVLGQGGMGVVLGAVHLKLDERVAIKFLLPELAHDPALVGRFLREGRAAIKIRSEHVVRVFDVATLPGGTPYMVMEHLEGRNLEEVLEEQGRMASELAVNHVLQATEALAEAHALGMVHRDLKPANLFLAHRADGSPCVKVLDFGITKIVEAEGPNAFDATKTSVVMGSPRYMSPEQMRSTRVIDARADIWALGVVLHELITGVAPFDGATMPDLLAAILQDPPPPLRQLRPEAPEGLEKVIAKCLEKDPENRYADVAELTEALAPFGSASARLSADRVSRVIRPRNTLAPPPTLIPPSLAPASSSFKPEAPSSMGNVTISATASAWGTSKHPARPTARTVIFAVSGFFVAATLLVAMFGGGEKRPASSQGAVSASPPAAAAPMVLPAESDSAFPSVGLVPTAAPIDSFELVAPRPTSTVSASKRHPRPAAAPSASPERDDPDLFDGRK